MVLSPCGQSLRNFSLRLHRPTHRNQYHCCGSTFPIFCTCAMHHPDPTFPFLSGRRLRAALLCAGLCLGLLGASGTAHSAERKKTDRAASAAAAGPEAKKKGSVKVKHQRSPSEESTAERERRLYRECRGRPNAGACLGYAHGRP